MTVKQQDGNQKIQDLLEKIMPIIRSKELKYVLGVLLFGIIFMLLPNLTTIYPIGHDSSAYLGNLRVMFEINFKTDYVFAFPFLPFVFSLLYTIGLDMVLFLKVYSIVVYGFAGLAIYYFSRKNLEWDNKKSFVAAIIFLACPITLRMGWELHSQTLGMIFFFVALVQLSQLSQKGNLPLDKRLRSKNFFLLLLLTILIGWVHLLVAIFFFFILSSIFLFKLVKSRKVNYLLVFFGVVLAISTVVFSIVLTPNELGPSNPTNLNAAIGFVSSSSSVSLSWLFSLFLFSYSFLIPFALVGFFSKSKLVPLMLIFPTVFILSYFLLSFSFIPLERALYLFQYPLSLFAVNGLYHLNSFETAKKIGKLRRIFSLRNVTIFLVLVLIVFQSLNMTGLFQPIRLYRTPPEGYPSTLQWSGIAPREIDSVISITKWCNANLNSSSLLIVPAGAFGWVRYYLHDDLSVAKWNIYYQPFGTTLVSENKSLLYVPEEIPEKLLTDPVVTSFSSVYVLYLPSWDIQNAINAIYPLAEKTVEQGDVILYRIKPLTPLYMIRLPGELILWTGEGKLILWQEPTNIDTIYINGNTSEFNQIGWRYIFDPKVNLTNAITLNFEINPTLFSEAAPEIGVWVYLHGASESTYNMYALNVVTNGWTFASIRLDKPYITSGNFSFSETSKLSIVVHSNTHDTPIDLRIRNIIACLLGESD
ncbi:MAG: hypothetical protein P8Y17_02130 [Patescibacteria group bacterium]|jgi:hypothetical protein